MVLKCIKLNQVKLELSRTLWSSWAQKPSCVHCFLFIPEARTRLSLHDFPWAPKGSLEQLLIKEARGWRDRRSSQDNSAALGRCSLVLPQGIHLTESWSSSVAQILPAMQETWVLSLGLEDSLEKRMATHSNILAWKIPGTEEPGQL